MTPTPASWALVDPCFRPFDPFSNVKGIRVSFKHLHPLCHATLTTNLSQNGLNNRPPGGAPNLETPPPGIH